MSDATTSAEASRSFDEAALREAIERGDLDDDPRVRNHHPLRRLVTNRNVTIAAAGVLVCIFLSIVTNTFLTEFNLINMLRNVSLIGTIAVGMTLLFIVGEIDLSVGSVMGFLTMVLGVFIVRQGMNPWLAALLVILCGIGTGLLNGLIRTVLNIPSFIVTLAMLTAYRSLALIVSNERPISKDPDSWFYSVTGGTLPIDLGGTTIHMPWLIVWMFVVMLIGGVILARTKYGYHAYATGGNLQAANDSGIDTNRVKLIAFMATGGLCGLAAVLLFGYLHVAEPTSGTGLEFRVIGAVIIGGAALTGGRGTIVGTLIGTLIIAVITGGMVLLGFSQGAADIAAGFLIIVVGTIDLLLGRAARRQ